MDITQNHPNILAVIHYENEGYVNYVLRDTKLEEMINDVCGRWTSLTPNKVLLRYALPGQKNAYVTLLQDMDVCCMFELHHRSGSNSIHINVSFKVNEGDTTMNEGRSTKRSEYDSNSTIVESSQSKRKITKFWENEITEVGQEFSDAAHFRQALINYSIAWNFNFKYIKNDRTRITACCASNGCGWRIHASRVGLCDRFEIKRLNKEHTCGRCLDTLSHPRASRRWVATIGKSKFLERPSYKPIEMMKDISTEYGVQVPYHTVWHGKEFAMKEMNDDRAYSYDMLRWYRDAVVKANPGSIFELEVDSESKCFKRLFFSFHASIVGFEVGCRPLLFLDSTFLESEYQGIILAATALNGDNGIFPLAFAIVDQETDDNWSWFLIMLRRIVSHQRQITFISDRAKGLSSSIPQIFPDSHHSYCLRYLIENFKTEVCIKYNATVRSRLVDSFKMCAYAYQEQEFDRHYLSLSGESKLATQFIDNSGKHHWAHAYFEGERYGNMYSNVVECCNNWILEARHLPITQLVDHIRIRMMEMQCKGMINSSEWDSIICPEVEKELEKNIKASQGLRCSASVSLNAFEVHDSPSVTVYLDSKECSCRAWQIFQIPCNHACAAIQWIGRSVYDYCNPYFKIELYRAAYDKAIYPVSSIDQPPIDVNNVQIRPPKMKKCTEINRKKRIESNNRETQPIKCGRCKQYGHHNRKTCTAPIED